jgi:hypothetical protein
MINKKGVSTIEIIVSFAIFVTFIIFILIYLNPIRQEISPVLLAGLETGLKKEASVELKEVPFIVSGNIPPCFEIPLASVFDLSNGEISVIDVDNKVIPHQRAGNSIQIQKQASRFYRLIQSSEIERTNAPLTGCTVLPQQDYVFSVERTVSIYSYKKLNAINKSYYLSAQEYTNLKRKFNYPITSDFGIIVQAEDFNITMNRTIPSNLQIKAGRYPIQVLQNDAKKSATLSLIVW